MDRKEEYINYIDEWMGRKENCGRSFTYGNALYDYINEYRADLDDLGIREYIVDSIEGESQADRDWIEGLTDKILVEVVDIALLDELGREIQEEVDLYRNEEENV